MKVLKTISSVIAISGITFSFLIINPQRAAALDENQSAQVLIWFYGDSMLQEISDAGGMTAEAVRQSEDMLNGVLSCSMQMGYAESLFRQTYKIPTSFVSFVGNLGTSVAKQWLSSELGAEQKIYETCKTSIARSYRGAALGALQIR